MLALLCAGVILFSALWTRNQNPAVPDSLALSDESQRLRDVTPPPDPPSLFPPCLGEIIRPFTTEIVPFSACWKTHPAVDFAVTAGETVHAMESGTVESAGDQAVLIRHGDGTAALYLGVRSRVQEGAFVRRGDGIGAALGSVPFEGSGILCVSFYQRQTPVDFEIWIDTEAK